MNLFKKLFRKKSEEKNTAEMESPKPLHEKEIEVTEIENIGNSEHDVVFEAWTSTNLNKMLQVTNVKTSLMNRHYLLQSIVNESYKLRDQEEYKNVCLNYSEIHLTEFEQIAHFLKKESGGILPRVTTFQNYATLLTEIGEYLKSISVCEMAIAHKLDDGTKSNYEGRIERVKKKYSTVQRTTAS